MAFDKKSLLDGSNTKAPNVALLIYFVFALLWLGFGIREFSGAALDPDSAAENLIKGVLATLAVALLAARVRIAPIGVTILGVMILATPYCVPAHTARNSLSEFQAEKIEQLSMSLAKPPPLRDTMSIDALKQKGYVEAPEIAQRIADYNTQIEAWLRDNASAVRRMESTISKSTACKKYATAEEYHADLMTYLQAPRAYTGTNWAWFGLWLSHAQELGFKQPSELPPDQTQRATDYARDWLEAHPDALNSQFGIMETSERDEQEVHAREVKKASSLSITMWIVLFAIGAAWSGRQAFHRSWDAFQFLPWALDGMRRLVRKDRYAVLRTIGGLVMMGLLGVLVSVLTITHFNNRPVGKLIVWLMVMAGMTVCSGLSFGENEPGKVDDTLQSGRRL
jgi:hypothetical protein